MTQHLLAGQDTFASLAETSDRRAPHILVFDSGIGGLSVLADVRLMLPDARYLYVADNAAFPYGRLPETSLVARVIDVIGRLIELHAPDLVIIACNTASTLVLPHLRHLFTVPFVGTVPAIKPAALASSTKCISVLATPGTVARDYTQELIRTYASHCQVTLVGSDTLATLAESELAGRQVSSTDIENEILPCFVDDGSRRTDTIVLGCTHYPLLKHRFDALAPWPVAWIDSGAAIARRTVELLGRPSALPPAPPFPLGDMVRNPAPDLPPLEVVSTALFTSSLGVSEPLVSALMARGVSHVAVKPMPLSL